MLKIAYKNLKHYRHTVHLYLDAIWAIGKSPQKARTSCYKWLAGQMGLSVEETHVKYFNRDQCKQAIKILRPRYIQLYGEDLPWRKDKDKMNRIRVTRHKEFEAAHLLPEYPGDCGNLHGHTYKIEVSVEGPQTGLYGMVMDFKELDKAIKEVMPDHRYLHFEGNPISNDIVAVLDKYNLKYVTFPWATTAENMCKYIGELIEEYIQKELDYKEVQVVEVKLWETTNSYASWNKEYKENK